MLRTILRRCTMFPFALLCSPGIVFITYCMEGAEAAKEQFNYMLHVSWYGVE